MADSSPDYAQQGRPSRLGKPWLTTIEEYRYLLMIGAKVGEQGMPPLRLPQ